MDTPVPLPLGLVVVLAILPVVGTLVAQWMNQHSSAKTSRADRRHESALRLDIEIRELQLDFVGIVYDTMSKAARFIDYCVAPMQAEDGMALHRLATVQGQLKQLVEDLAGDWATRMTVLLRVMGGGLGADLVGSGDTIRGVLVDLLDLANQTLVLVEDGVLEPPGVERVRKRKLELMTKVEGLVVKLLDDIAEKRGYREIAA